MDSAGIQAAFFRHIREMLPPHFSLVDEVASLLNISNDSAYRRIRGEKPIMLEEIQKLATSFNISLDQFLHLQSDSFLFSGKLTNLISHRFDKWLEDTLQQLQYIHSFSSRHLYYLTKDIPVTQLFHYPELTAFKSFFWQKTILQYEEQKELQYSFSEASPFHLEMGKKIVEVYNKIPSTEIWHPEGINTFIRQIQFYREAHVFKNDDEAVRIYETLLKLMDHLERQAEAGMKFGTGAKAHAASGTYHLFYNELITGDNTVLADVDNRRITFLNHSVINFLGTRDERFNTYMFEIFQNHIKKATPLSKTSEKQRLKFFNRLRDKIRHSAGL